MLESVVKRSEFVYTREYRYTKVIFYYHYYYVHERNRHRDDTHTDRHGENAINPVGIKQIVLF